MGMSADAKIVYGLALDEDTTVPWKGEDDDYGDIEDWWDKLHGYNNPHEDFDKEKEFQWNKADENETYKAYKKYKNNFKKKAPKLPVEITSAGCDSFSTNVLYVKDTMITTDWSAMKFDPAKLVVSQKQAQEFVEFVIKYLGEDRASEIGWYLVPYYG